jgi:MarR family transcriptional regulator, organic hydroperoxide resistance regulator
MTERDGVDDNVANYPSTARGGPVSYSIFLLARAHRGYAAALLRSLRLHPGQELLLMQLLDRDHQLQGELLDSVGLDHSTVSKSLRRMQEAGLLTRTPSEHDRRSLVVSLTEQGRAMRGPLEQMWSALEAVSVPDIDPDTAARFIHIATVIRKSVAERVRLPSDIEPSAEP